jgi:glycosyltransferase involved in cell wall biosynthesis
MDGVDPEKAWPYGDAFMYEGPVGVRYRWIPAVVEAIGRSQAEVLYQRGISVLTIAAARARAVSGTGFVWAASSDGDADGVLLRFRRAVRFRRSEGRSILSPKTWLGAAGEAYIHARGVAAARNADAIVAQASSQAEALVRRMRIPRETVRVIPSVAPGSDSGELGVRSVVLWVGGAKPIKRPELFVELAEKGPSEFEYAMAGKGLEETAWPEYGGGVRLLGALSHDEVMRWMSQTSLLVNTSEAEGFPNTFLEAWAHGAPVLTLGVDPDGIISTHKLGWVCASVEDAVEVLRLVARRPEVRVEYGHRCRRFVEDRFGAEKTVEATARVLSAAAASARAARLAGAEAGK